MTAAVGIDIGGTGIKGGIVDVDSGELISDRVKRQTPTLGTPGEIVKTVREVLHELDAPDSSPLGVCFPAVVKSGRTLSAANVSQDWIGFEAEKFFEQELGRNIHFVNDADAAGIAEMRFGAASRRTGLTIVTTLGTGIGSALIYNGVLIPNAELGHLEMNGSSAEKQAASSALKSENLDWAEWSVRLNQYYQLLEALFSPDLFVVGGGVSKYADDFLPLLRLSTEIVPAMHRNNAGILGAAWLAVE